MGFFRYPRVGIVQGSSVLEQRFPEDLIGFIRLLVLYAFLLASLREWTVSRFIDCLLCSSAEAGRRGSRTIFV